MNVFQPLPLLSNPHIQTIVGNYLLGLERPANTHRRRVTLPDGDRIVLHETPPRRKLEGSEPLALLVHGLCGSHRSGSMQRMAARLSALGWRVFRMDLRGAGAGIRLARRLYSAACSDDVAEVADHLMRAQPEAPLAVLGFSLGGNIVLKYAGEQGARQRGGLRAVAALAPPIDLVRCSDKLAQYPVYDSFYVRNLTRQALHHARSFPEQPLPEFPRRLNLREFDDLYTAPRWGYASALDYYQKASAQPWIEAIRVPTFILTARDDPFVAVESFETLRAPPGVEVHISARGGHMGFLGSDGSCGIRWAETQILNWLQHTVQPH